MTEPARRKRSEPEAPKRGDHRPNLPWAVAFVAIVLGASLYAYQAGVEAQRRESRAELGTIVPCVDPDTGETDFALIWGEGQVEGRVFILVWDEEMQSWLSVGIWECG